MSEDTPRTETEFDYRLNSFELASQSDNPYAEGYAQKRKRMFDYVRQLESHFAEEIKGADDACNLLAAWAIKNGFTTGHADTLQDLLRELEWQIRERERR